jgi:hypothetical protein
VYLLEFEVKRKEDREPELTNNLGVEKMVNKRAKQASVGSVKY